MSSANAFHNIEHIVHLMLENRSFDNVLGWLYDSKNPPARILGRDQSPFHGLREETYFNSLTPGGKRHYVQRGVSLYNTPRWDPNEEFEHVTKQLFGTETPTHGTRPGMNGFLADYATAKELIKFGPELGPEKALDILKTFTPNQLRVLNGLARSYAVSDQWFASVPTQTNANRSFSLAGTSMGLVNNAGPWWGIQPVGEKTRTIWHALYEHGWTHESDWMIYYQANDLLSRFSYTQLMFPHLPDGAFHFAPIDAFFRNARLGLLPRYSYLEPNWYALVEQGNDYHPPASVAPGERMLKRIYDAVSGQAADSTEATRAAWQKTLFIVTFDEHGGTYDHVPPPWGARPPWGDHKPPFSLEQGFGFDRFGVRVPALLISPWVFEGTVFRSETEVPYDHTSVIATILSWAGVERRHWRMGERVAHAPTFTNVLCRETPREPSSHTLSAEAEAFVPEETRISGLHQELLRPIIHHLSEGKLSNEEVDARADEIAKSATTPEELKKAIEDLKSSL